MSPLLTLWTAPPPARECHGLAQSCGSQTPDIVIKSDPAKNCIAELGRKYLWWDPVGDEPHSENRIIAQAMNLATYEDIVVLEKTLGKSGLVEVMLRAEPGWLSDRSWEFWRGRLSLAVGAAIPKGSSKVP